MNMPFSKIQLFIQSHSVDLCTTTRVLFFEENWNLKVKAIVKSKYFSWFTFNYSVGPKESEI